MKAKVVYRKNDNNNGTIDRLYEELKKANIEIDNLDSSSESPSFIIVVGGDGTMLNAIKDYQYMNLPFVGINTGTLGFLMNERAEKVEKVVRRILSCDYDIFRYPLFLVRITDMNGETYERNFVGDLVVERSSMNLTEMEIYLNHSPLNYFAGDGYIVATPIGSTAYAVWAGGAAIHHSLHCLEMVPMHPNDSARNLPMKIPMVVPANTHICFEVLFPEQRSVRIAVDGFEIKNPTPICKIEITQSDHSVTFWNISSYDYFQRIKSKIIDKERIRKIRT